jgi:hypothetical protein
MKSATFLALLSVLGAASSVNGKKVSYDGSKAMRIAVGSDVTAVKSLIDTLSLPTWKGVVDGMPQADGYVDLVVPYEKIAAFEELTVDMATQVMHEDLGASIAEESGEVSTYAGKWCSTSLLPETCGCHHHAGLQVIPPNRRKSRGVKHSWSGAFPDVMGFLCNFISAFIENFWGGVLLADDCFTA